MGPVIPGGPKDLSKTPSEDAATGEQMAMKRLANQPDTGKPNKSDGQTANGAADEDQAVSKAPYDGEDIDEAAGVDKQPLRLEQLQQNIEIAVAPEVSNALAAGFKRVMVGDRWVDINVASRGLGSREFVSLGTNMSSDTEMSDGNSVLQQLPAQQRAGECSHARKKGTKSSSSQEKKQLKVAGTGREIEKTKKGKLHISHAVHESIKTLAEKGMLLAAPQAMIKTEPEEKMEDRALGLVL
ncbi:hypothetical protein EJB05_30210, partial [Eragrostis curvula]